MFFRLINIFVVVFLVSLKTNAFIIKIKIHNIINTNCMQKTKLNSYITHSGFISELTNKAYISGLLIIAFRQNFSA